MLKARNKPFVMVFWSRDPDGTQHNQGDSLNQLTPGINGPTSLAGIKNADDDLAKLRAALDQLGLAATTDIVVSADHGFCDDLEGEQDQRGRAWRITPTCRTAFCRRASSRSISPRPWAMPLFDTDDGDAPIAAGQHPKVGSALIGKNPAHPDFVVAANGGSDLVYCSEP